MGDSQALERGAEWLRSLLSLAGFSTDIGVEPPQLSPELAHHWLTIPETNLTGEQVQTLLGKQGQVLDAIQYLINATLNLGHDKESHVTYTVELAKHRLNRINELQSIATQVAEQVRAQGNEQEMPPLSAAERRIVHTLFQAEPDLETFSRGQEPDRRLVIRPLTNSEPA